MSDQLLSIQQLRFEIGFYSKEKTYELQNRISRLFYQQIHPLLQQYLEQAVRAGTLIKKDSVLLELGILPIEQLEQELPERLQRAVAEQFAFLAPAGGSQQPANGFDRLPAEAGDLRLLEHFLLTGALPWQASGRPFASWQVALCNLYERGRGGLRSLLEELGKQQAVRRRMAYQSTQEEMQKIIATVEPAEAPVIMAYREKIITAHQKKQVVQSDTAGFGQALSFFILTYLLAEMDSVFSRKQLIKSILHQMAAHYNISFQQLLAALHDALPAETQSNTRSSSLFALVEQLHGEEQAQPDVHYPEWQKDRQSGSPAAAQLNILWYFLAKGTLPAGSATIGKAALADCLEKLIKTAPDTCRSMLAALPGREAAARVADLLTGENMAGVLSKLLAAQGEAGRMESAIRLLEQWLSTRSAGDKTILQAAIKSFVLQRLVTGNGDPLVPQNLFRHSIQHLSSQTGEAAEKILHQLIACIQARPASGEDYAAFLPLLQEMTGRSFPDKRKHAFSAGVNKKRQFHGDEQPKRTLFDVLGYFLQFGAMPWWAMQYAARPPEAMLEDLYAVAAPAALLLVKKAVMQEAPFHRLLAQFPAALLDKICSRLPNWDAVAGIREEIIQLIKNCTAGKSVEPTLDRALLGGLLDSYAIRQFRSFDEAHFYQAILSHCPELMRLHEASIPERLRKAIRERRAAGFAEYLLHQSPSPSETARPSGPVDTSGRYQNLDALIIRAAGTVALTAAQRLHHAVSLLEFYLIRGRLPDDMHINGERETDERLEEMLLLLYHEDRSALERILVADRFAGKARMRLHSLFSYQQGGDHKQISLLLNSVVEKDIGACIRLMTGNEAATDQAWKPALDRMMEKAKAGRAENMAALLSLVPFTKYIVSHYGEHTVRNLLKLLPATGKAVLVQTSQVSDLLLDMVVHPQQKEQLRTLLHEFTLLHFSGPVRPLHTAGYVKELFLFLLRSLPGSDGLLARLLHTLLAEGGNRLVEKETAAAMRYVLQHEMQLRAKKAGGSSAMAARERKKQEAASATLQQKLQHELQEKQPQAPENKKRAPVSAETDKHYVANAGLVLLHPFLGTYFQRLGLMEKGQFRNPEAHARAVHMLQYLAYKTTAHAEHELVLNKILCHYPLPETLPLEITVEPWEAALAEELMQVAIQRAGKLSNSSPDGFRVTFLHRQGVLTQTEEAWTLRIEQKGYDMMLQTLPWAFGMIKFGWMEKPLYVEWI